ncbi:mycofactocin oligosaccharide methyltransferase MftM [Gordonia sinesedis]
MSVSTRPPVQSGPVRPSEPSEPVRPAVPCEPVRPDVAPTLRSAGTPTRRRVTVRQGSAPPGFAVCDRIAWRHGRSTTGPTVEVVHPYTAADISDDVMVSALECLVAAKALTGQWEFEEAAVGMIRTAAPQEDAGWAAFYDNSIQELRGGRARFAPVHRRARSLLIGESVLEVGCCFGFLAVQCAEAGYRVAACDISPGAVGLLDRQSRRRGARVDAVVGDATDLPFDDNGVDTVTLVHLLEHLDERQIRDALREAVRVARRRVVVAVPFEELPSEHFGHRVRLSEADLHDWARCVDHAGARTFTDHGGWLVLTPHRR